MYIDTTEDFQGLFGVVRGQIQDITVTGNIVNAGNQSGGIVGSAGGSTIIMNCHNQVTIYSEEGTSIGGIVGYIVPNASILNCSNRGNITALGQQGEYQETYVGGIIGRCDGQITGCYNTGDIYGYHVAGGIAGVMMQGELRDCYNRGDIKVDFQMAGGISGSIHYYTGGNVGYTRIMNTYSTGTVTGPSQIGASIGAVTTPGSILQADNNYALNQNSVPAIGGGVTNTNVKAELKTSEELKQLIGTLGEAFQADAKNINDGYPILSWQ